MLFRLLGFLFVLGVHSTSQESALNSSMSDNQILPMPINKNENGTELAQNYLQGRFFSNSTEMTNKNTSDLTPLLTVRDDKEKKLPSTSHPLVPQKNMGANLSDELLKNTTADDTQHGNMTGANNHLKNNQNLSSTPTQDGAGVRIMTDNKSDTNSKTSVYQKINQILPKSLRHSLTPQIMKIMDDALDITINDSDNDDDDDIDHDDNDCCGCGCGCGCGCRCQQCGYKKRKPKKHTELTMTTSGRRSATNSNAPMESSEAFTVPSVSRIISTTLPTSTKIISTTARPSITTKPPKTTFTVPATSIVKSIITTPEATSKAISSSKVSTKTTTTILPTKKKVKRKKCDKKRRKHSNKKLSTLKSNFEDNDRAYRTVDSTPASFYLV